jgi:hypothetical protein
LPAIAAVGGLDDPDGDGGGTSGSGGPEPESSQLPALNPFDALPEPAVFVQTIVDGVRQHVAATVRPAAVVAVAEAFSFPLILMLVVLVFLLAQGRMDDPKFRMAPLTKDDTTIAFEDEEATT